MKPGRGRHKGARGESEVLKILEAELGLKLVRNKHQAERGGRDIAEDVDRMQGPIPFAIEVKYQERELLAKWWEQTVEQAMEVQRMPVLFFRRNHQPWRVVIDPHDANPLTWPRRGGYMILPLEIGLQWMRENL